MSAIRIKYETPDSTEKQSSHRKRDKPGNVCSQLQQLASKRPRSEDTDLIAHFPSRSKTQSLSSVRMLVRLVWFSIVINTKIPLAFQRGFRAWREDKVDLFSILPTGSSFFPIIWTVFPKGLMVSTYREILRGEKEGKCLSILVLPKGGSLHEKESAFSKDSMGLFS